MKLASIDLDTQAQKQDQWTQALQSLSETLLLTQCFTH
jgi:hypothetical protein